MLILVGDKSSLDNFLNQLKVAEAQLGRVKAETKAITQANKIQLSIETGGYESKVDSLIARTRQWTDANGNARISTDNLSLAFDKLLSASNAFSEATPLKAAFISVTRSFVNSAPDAVSLSICFSCVPHFLCAAPLF